MTFSESQINKVADKEVKRIIVCYKNKSKTVQISELFLKQYKLTVEGNKEVNKICQDVFNKETVSVVIRM